ncbi:MAG TPA: hypothetical protein VF610_04600 [Segetibacter sp.]
MKEFFLKLLSDIPVKVVSSLVFLYVALILLRPWIKITPFICKDLKDSEPYRIKIVNRSWFSAIDVKIEMNVLERRPTPPTGMMNELYSPLTVKYSHLFYLPAYRPRWWRKEARHALRVKPLDDLQEILSSGNKTVQIKVSCKHGLGGLTKVFMQEYSDLSQIKDGRYTYGTKFDVLY